MKLNLRRQQEALAEHLADAFKHAEFSRQQFRITDGILEGTQHWVAELAGTLENLEGMVKGAQDLALHAARLDTEKLAEQLNMLRGILRDAMGEDPNATLH